ncbi:alpha-L RNA-binding motif-containing protein [Lentinus tigrinus ALCF2SS1-7]|uniref:Alpha-L RNA-binding motif-containing protein n=1 Tax=Lentinus tigrinus ALCF2SS1-6 TaxID=1328759 RepID=A0A5C2RZP2_9APHY|nr:alpha-L RNA-binding motif-containing protein [Lentinus tigrinus ALCF2SS1-6]RPD79546.1 alpha-L RNA-binding motif-containing protein [Lentinus tigrinus ALCF2SS1-7]
MRDAHIYNFKRGLPRMSWHPHNLYNLWRRSYGPLEKITDRVEYKETLNWRRWTAKALLRGYHGDFINEKIFKRWYLPETLPDVRPSEALKKVGPSVELDKWATKEMVAQKTEKRLEEEKRKGLAPVGSLMFAEVERRIDVVIFRACLAHSVYDARRMVIHGSVLLNGKKHTDANTRLAPGDMVSVDPKAIRFLQPEAEIKEEAEAEDAEAAESSPEESAADEGAEAEASAESAAESESSPKVAPSTSKFAKKSKPSAATGLTPFHPPPYASPFLFVPAYLEPSFSTCSVIYLRHPTARPGYSEIPTPWDADGEVVRLAWEWYSKRRMRIRSKSQLARMPENRQ